MQVNPIIPHKMSNDESKVVAGLVVATRNYDIAEGKFIAFHQRKQNG